MPESISNLLTAAQVSRELHLPNSQISRAIRAGRVRPDFQTTTTYLFRRESVPRVAAKLTKNNHTTTT